MNLKLYLKAARPFSFTVSFFPPILALALAFLEDPDFSPKWGLFIMTFLGGFIAHAGSNMVSDYFDYRKGIDRPGTYGSSQVLVAGEMSPVEMLILGLACLAVGALLGLAIMLMIPGGFSLLWLILIGGFLGLFYTAPPFVLKYTALGDLAVFMAFGPLMTLGGYFVQTGHYSIKAFLISIPVAMLVDAILHANNTRDIENDKNCQIKTVAGIIGRKNSIKMYQILVYGCYAAVVLMTILKLLPIYSLVVFLSLPLAKSNVKKMQTTQTPPDADAMTAKLHSAFSLLFTVGLLLGRLHS